MDKLLEIKDLTVSFGKKRVIDNVNISVSAGRITTLVGESGSGKTLTALATLNLLPQAALIEKGEVLFRGQDMLTISETEIRKIRGKDISMVFQEPFTALNPVMRVGDQIKEMLMIHENMKKSEFDLRLKELFNTVKLSEDTGFRYPHELSGGMCQRVMIAMALSCNPEILIMDEPTTALDVPVQKEILDLVQKIQEENKFGILFITHDFSVVNLMADDVHVMKDGIIVESGTKQDVLSAPKHEYTRHLIDCIPRLGDERTRFPVRD